MTLASGSRLGPYEILSPLGAGGMGEVYRARDTRLERTVAIKVLQASLAADPDRRLRFEREARAVSSLNHPHICTLHDIGQQDGFDYLVMECVEGQTLAERLEKGPLPLDQVLRYGGEMAGALDRAHRAGIVHRDLKPANVMLTKSGVKLLDFGLAKLRTEGGAGTLSALATAEKPLTGEGTLLGTLPYMSPEQVEGKEADARSDIWALGTVLYEMATGKPAFEGKSQASLIAAILEHEPQPITSLQPLAPPALERLVKACLAKDPDERWQSAHDVAVELRWIPERHGEVATAARGRRRALPLALAGGLGALLAAGLLWIASHRESAGGGPALRVTDAVRFTHETGLFESTNWSPDGTLVAFASNRSGNFEIYVRRVDGGQEVNVTSHPSEDIQPAFSPDGRSIAFVSTRSSRTGVVPAGGTYGMDVRTFGGDLWIAPALGGTARRLARDANYPTWRPDGRAILYVSGSEDHRSLHEVSADGTPLRELLSSVDSTFEVTSPHYSPDGRWISFDGLQAGKIFLLPAAGGRPRELIGAGGHAWADDGSLFYIRKGAAGGSSIGHVAVDAQRGLAAGPERVVAVLTGWLFDLAVSPGSHQLAVAELDAGFNLTRLPLSPDGRQPAGPEEPLNSGSFRDRYPAYSFDGRRLAYSSNRAGPNEVWVLDLEDMRHERLPVPQDDLGTDLPSWLPDGNLLLVKRYRPGGPVSLWVLSLDGSRAEQLPGSREIPVLGSCGISPDGRRVLVQHPEGNEIQLYELDLVTHEERRLPTVPGNKYDPIWSRDGRQIAYLASTAGTLQLWTQPAQGGEPRQLTFGVERMRHASFSPDGRWIYVQPSHRNIWRVPTAGGTLEQVTTFPESGLFLEEPTLSADGRALVYARRKGGASVWLLSLATKDSLAKQ